MDEWQTEPMIILNIDTAMWGFFSLLFCKEAAPVAILIQS